MSKKINYKFLFYVESCLINSLRPVICNFYKFPRVSCDCIIFCKFPPSPFLSNPIVKKEETFNARHKLKGMIH